MGKGLRKRFIKIFAGGLLLAGLSEVVSMAPVREYKAFHTAVYLDVRAEGSLYEHQWALHNTGRIKLEEGAERSVLSSGPAFDSGRDPGFSVQRVTMGLEGADIHAEAAWNLYSQMPEKRPVVVALVDTGVDISHPDLQNGIWINTDEIPGDGIDNDQNGYIDDVYGWNFCSGSNQIYVGEEDDHGTHAAGTIIGNWDQKGITGIADSNYVKIMVLKALGSDGKGDSSEVIEAIRYAQANGASICNLSFGADIYDPQLAELIQNSNMLFVISAGNGDSSGFGFDIDQTPIYPAAFTNENIISVANLMFDGTLHPSSNYGAQSVDLAAPGSYIVSTTTNHNYGYMTGTSMAAPMVSGAAALISSCRADLTMTDMKQALLYSAKKLESLDGKVASGGMLDIYGALSYQIPGFGLN